MSAAAPIKPEIHIAYADYTAAVRLRNSKVACVLVIALMPAGILLDKFVYPDYVRDFLILRLACSALTALVFWGLLRPNLSAGQVRLLCMGWYLLPAFFISWMIGATQGSVSPYYAGLNLVILAVSTVIQATLLESVISVLLIILMYFVACALNAMTAPFHWRMFFNNMYFITLTTIIVSTGTAFFNRLRFREFILRHELDESRQDLERNNLKLDRQNKELADTIQKLTEAESQLVQSEKMASLGRMSAGIIHEINNPLNFATTGIFTLKKKAKHIAPEQQEEYNEILKDVEDGVLRVKNIVSDLRMFTHPSTDNLDQVDAAEVVTSALRFLSNETKDKVAIAQKFAAGQAVHANKNKLIHVFVNLIQNSLDALKDKPFPAGEKPAIWIEGRETPAASFLIIRDNGAGIASEHVDKIFDPFYTTKEVGAGMGLGLSICYRIMQECRGKISVRTEPGKFCEFTLEFPKQP